MKRKRARSGGVRNPGRNAVLFGLASIASIVLVALGVADMRETGQKGSPLLMLGLFPALLCPIVFIHYVGKVRVFRDMRSGRSAIARWTVPPGQFDKFREEQQRIPAGSILTNFYAPPRVTPPEGVEVIFSDDGVLIGGGYFPLSPTRGRRLESVRYIDSDPPAIEFGTVSNTMVRTSSATIDTVRTAQSLRVPVSIDARKEAGEVVRRFQGAIDRMTRLGGRT
jgi:hypothetical protein